LYLIWKGNCFNMFICALLKHNICSFHSSIADDSCLVGFDLLFLDEVSKECSASIFRVTQLNKNSCLTNTLRIEVTIQKCPEPLTLWHGVTSQNTFTAVLAHCFTVNILTVFIPMCLSNSYKIYVSNTTIYYAKLCSRQHVSTLMSQH